MPLLLLSLLALAQTGADWTRFRGPTGDGIAPPQADPPVDWSETKNVAWKTPLPGRGRSAPVVLGGRLFVTTAIEHGLQRQRIGPDDMQTAERVELEALSIDAGTGSILWRAPLRIVDQPDPVHWLNSWATPTPAVEAGRVFCDYGVFGTWCLDSDSGKVLWGKRVPVDHQVGPGSSPVLVGGLVVLVRDGRDAQYITALDGKTGEAVWKTDRPPIKAANGNLKKSFSTPILIAQGGGTQLVAVTSHWAVAYEPPTGKEIWRVRHGDGYSIGTAPVFGQGLLYVGTGFGKANLLAIRADGTGDATEGAIAWRIQKGVPAISSPLFAGESLYWNSDEGVATCADPKSGTIRWQERLGEQHVASPIFAAGRIYFFGREGKTTVVKPGPTFQRLAENRLEGPVSATPAVSGKSLFLRNDTHLYRIESH